jgi:hypothetical protein
VDAANCAHVRATGWGKVPVCGAFTTCVVVSSPVYGLVDRNLLWLGPELRWCRMVGILVYLLAFAVGLEGVGPLVTLYPVGVSLVVVVVFLM